MGAGKYIDVVEPILRSLRDVIMPGFGTQLHELKLDNTVVTEIDRKAEQLITEALLQAYPDIGINGEEFGKSGSSEMYWLIDPIDGTENFIRGIDGIGTILGLVEDGKMKFAAVYNPVNDRLYWAERGAGAWCNGDRLISSYRKNQKFMIDVDCSNDMQKHGGVLDLLLKNGVATLKLHGSAHRCMLIADGKIDGTIRYQVGGSDWDYAPGNLLMTEAGAEIVYIDKRDEISSRSFVVASAEFLKVFNNDLVELLG